MVCPGWENFGYGISDFGGALPTVLECAHFLYSRSEGHELPRALARGWGLPILMGFSPNLNFQTRAKAQNKRFPSIHQLKLEAIHVFRIKRME